MCRNSFEGIFVNFDTFGNVLSKIYLPWYWPDGMVLMQDMVALTSQIYVNCSVDKLMVTLTHLPTIEGGTAMLGRIVASLNFEIADWQAISENPFATDTEKGCAAGHAAQAILKYQI